MVRAVPAVPAVLQLISLPSPCPFAAVSCGAEVVWSVLRALDLLRCSSWACCAGMPAPHCAGPAAASGLAGHALGLGGWPLCQAVTHRRYHPRRAGCVKCSVGCAHTSP